MDRQEIDAVVETIDEMVNDRYFDGIVKLFDCLTSALIESGSLSPGVFEKWLTDALGDVDHSSPGAKLLLREREICRLSIEKKAPPSTS